MIKEIGSRLREDQNRITGRLSAILVGELKHGMKEEDGGLMRI